MNKKYLVSSICLALLFANFLPLVRVFANPTTLKLDPASIVDETKTPGNSITLAVNVVDVTNLYAFEFKIYYKNNVLNATSAIRPAGHFLEPVDPANQFQPKWELKNDFNATHGRVWLSFTLLFPEAARTGNGTLAQITLNIIGVDSTALTFAEGTLVDDTGTLISHVEQGSFFDNRPPAPPAPPATIYVDPESLIDPALIPSNSFSVNVNIINGTDVLGYEFTLNFDPSIIEATSVLEGPYLSSVGSTTVLVTQIDNSIGFVRFGAALIAPPGANGDGTLAAITFHVLSMGASLLTISGTSLTDPLGQPLSFTTQDGYFANVILAKLFFDPPEFIDPTLRPGDIFYWNISIENIQNMYGYEFHFTYNTIVLTCFGAQINPIFGEMHYTPMFSVNDYLGEAFFNVSYYSPAPPISTIPPVAVVTLIFKVDNLGISDLAFHDTEIVDPSGSLISHETQDGFFQAVNRDVAVLDITLSRTVVYETWKVNISVTVKNLGDYFSETFNVTAIYDPSFPSLGVVIGVQTVHDLPPNQTATLLFTWNTAGVPPNHNYTILAHAQAVPYETQLTDNEFVDGQVKVKIMGDVNGDGRVDILDLTAVAIAFGSRPGDPNWNPDTDFDENGVINILDLVRVTINYGRTS
jgi:hypothetical protein